MIRKFKKKPVIIEALKFTGSEPNIKLMELFVGESFAGYAFNGSASHFHINTLEGKMTATVGDYIIKGIAGEFYPCKPAIFKKTYEAVK